MTSGPDRGTAESVAAPAPAPAGAVASAAAPGGSSGRAGLFGSVGRWLRSAMRPAPADVPGAPGASGAGPRGRRAGSGAWGGWGLWGEAALVAVATLVGIGAVWLIGHSNETQPSLGVAGVVLLALGIGSLPFRHHYPVAVLGVAFATTLAYWSLGYTRGPLWLPLVVALGHAVIVGRRRASLVVLVVGYFGFPWLGYLLERTERPPVVALVALAAWLVALVSVSEAVRSRRERMAEAARSEAEALRRQVTDERLRIARELHDVIAHNMSLISIQAGVALHLIDTKPDQVRVSLATIKDASKEALVELRSILGVLRLVDEEVEDMGAVGPLGPPEPGRQGREGSVPPGPGPAASGVAPPTESVAPPATGSEPSWSGSVVAPRSPAPRSPVPSLSRLDDLVERARVAGVEVEVEVGPGLSGAGRSEGSGNAVGLADSGGGRGSRGSGGVGSSGGVGDLRGLAALPRQVDLAAFRIVQESLTNVARHSDSPAVTVRLDCRDGGLWVDVLDEGSSRPKPRVDLPRGGSGLPGMRERAALVGGWLEAGPRPGRGFAVRAWLPIDEDAAAARPVADRSSGDKEDGIA